MSSMVGNPLSVPQGLYETSAVQRAPLGTRVRLGDHEYVYGQADASVAVVPGRLYQTVAVTANHGGTGLAVDAPAAGERVIAVTLGASAVTENQYAGGMLVMVNDTGGIANAGQSYKISGHPAAAASAAVNITLMDPLYEAVTAGMTVALIPPEGSGAILHPSPPTGPLLGVAMRDLAVSEFGWFCRKGIVGCLQEGALVNGNGVVASDTVDGAVAVLNATYVVDEPIVGICVSNTADADIAVIDLNLP